MLAETATNSHVAQVAQLVSDWVGALSGGVRSQSTLVVHDLLLRLVLHQTSKEADDVGVVVVELIARAVKTEHDGAPTLVLVVIADGLEALWRDIVTSEQRVRLTALLRRRDDELLVVLVVRSVIRFEINGDVVAAPLIVLDVHRLRPGLDRLLRHFDALFEAWLRLRGRRAVGLCR